MPPTRHLTYTTQAKSVFEGGLASLPYGTAETNVQTRWNDVYLERLKTARQMKSNPRQTILLVDTHNKQHLGNSEPDLISYLPNAPHQEFNIALIGENKPRRSSLGETFTDQEKGQLVGYLKKLLGLLPHRAYAIGFLTDGVLIQFFKLNAGPMNLVETPVDTLESKSSPVALPYQVSCALHF